MTEIDPKFRAAILQRWQGASIDQRLAMWDDAVKAGILGDKADLVHKLQELRQSKVALDSEIATKDRAIRRESMTTRELIEEDERKRQALDPSAKGGRESHADEAFREWRAKEKNKQPEKERDVQELDHDHGRDNTPWGNDPRYQG